MAKKDDSKYTELQKDFESLKKRRKQEIEEAERRGQDRAVDSLLDLVDDCDRALNQIYSGSDQALIAEGVRQLRNQTMRRFKSLGIQPHGKVGEKFDPNWHDAILAEESPGPSGQIIYVHTIGWYHKENQKVVRPAKVTVSKVLSKASTEKSKDSSSKELSSQQKQKNQPLPGLSKKVLAQAGDCFYGNPGCVNNSCPECQLRFKTLDVGGNK